MPAIGKNVISGIKLFNSGAEAFVIQRIAMVLLQFCQKLVTDLIALGIFAPGGADGEAMFTDKRNGPDHFLQPFHTQRQPTESIAFHSSMQPM